MAKLIIFARATQLDAKNKNPARAGHVHDFQIKYLCPNKVVTEENANKIDCKAESEVNWFA